jgi:hypothetical protein
MTTLPSGQIVPHAPAMKFPGVQDIQGSTLEAASSKTISANTRLAETAKAMGAGQRGGAENLNAHIASIPEAGTIRGVSYAGVHLKNADNLNQLLADKTGDALKNAQPFDPMPTRGGRRTKRHRKVNGRSNKRTHRRRNRKSTHRGGRRRSAVLKSMAKRK